MNAKRPVRGRAPWPAFDSPDDPREELCARQHVAYICDRGHTFEVTFAAEAKVPAAWDCRCGKPAGLTAAPDAGQTQHERRMALVLQRRQPAEGAAPCRPDRGTEKNITCRGLAD
jgi:hypothetical protein